MPPQPMIDTAIAQLHQQGQTPSVRTVHALTGGSFRDVSKALAVWRAAYMAPQARRYACVRFPCLAIGRHIRFCNGLYVTSDPAEQTLIEANDWFGGLIQLLP